MEAWNRGDWDAAFQDLADEIELDASSTLGEWRGTYRGPVAVRRLWQKYFIDPWESVRVQVDELIEADPHVVTRQTGYFLGRDGIQITNRTAWCWTFSGGKLIRLLLANELADALEAAGLRE
jgi:ketosteroid isomerase-like protein